MDTGKIILYYYVVNFSAIVIIPPEHIWESIQQIRMLHDPSFHRWMPHINLYNLLFIFRIYPFVQVASFSDILEDVETAASEISPFNITLQNFQTFDHKGSCTLWLNPECQVS